MYSYSNIDCVKDMQTMIRDVSICKYIHVSTHLKFKNTVAYILCTLYLISKVDRGGAWWAMVVLSRCNYFSCCKILW